MVYTEKFYVGYSDVTPELVLSNTSVLKMLENVAVMHATAAGDGMKVSTGRWFLTAYHVRVHCRPQHEERVRVKTWSREMRGASSSREFAIYGEGGALCVTALSNWARVDKDTGRIQRIPAELYEAYGSEPSRTNFGESRIPRPEECDDFTEKRTFYIDRNYIDANHHMNNVYYLELAELMLPDGAEPDEFEIHYFRAVPYRATVACLCRETEGGYDVAFKTEDLSEAYATVKFYCK